MTPTMYKVQDLQERKRHNLADEEISRKGNILNLVSDLAGSAIKAAGSVAGGALKGIRKGGKK